MTDSSLDTHDLAADPSDELVLRLRLVFEALDELEHTARSIQCPGCDPEGEVADRVREEVLARFDVDPCDANMLLGRAADVRGALLGILMPPCDHEDED